MKALLVVLLHFLLWQRVHLEDRSKWADPNDMINFDHASKKMVKKESADSEVPSSNKNQEDSELKQCTAQVECPKCECQDQKCQPCAPATECVCEQAALPLLRMYTQTLLTHLGKEKPLDRPEEYDIHITLTGGQVTIFENFAKTGDQRHIHDVHEILSGMINRVTAPRLGNLEKWAQIIEYKIGMSLDRLIQFFLLAALASIVLLIEVRLQIAWRRRVGQLVVFMFIISVPWTWYDLYKEAQIKQESKVARTVPADCKADANSYWKYLVSMVSLQEDKCLQYYESVMIDPLVKVPPTKAFAVTFVRFFVAPLKDIGASFSEFIRALLIDLPLTLYPVAIAMVCMFLFLLLIFMFGYSVRLPLSLLTIERNPQVAVLDNTVHQAVTEANQQTLNQLEQLQAKLVSTQNQLVDKLQHLEQIQQLAIEYCQSFGSSSPPGSPVVPSRAPAAAAQMESPVIELGASSSGEQNKEKRQKGETNKSAKEDLSVTKPVVNNGKGDMEPSPKGTTSYCPTVDTLMPDGVVETIARD